jgi:predicted transposase YbfD/YdcC
MGCQIDIVTKIRKKLADYVLALKGNQGNLHDDVRLFFDDPDLLAGCKYTKVTEKARGGIEMVLRINKDAAKAPQMFTTCPSEKGPHKR